MAPPRKRAKKPIKRAGMRADILQEWFGCGKPLNPERNVSEASDLIDDILRQQFFAEGLNEEEIRAAWKEVAGDFIANATEPSSVKEGQLVLRVVQPAMRYHLEQLKPELLRKIKAHFGAGKIKSIRFTHG